ncbi:AraC family transcriptional regulator [Vallitalea okinawensis]|uniref:AraC family transcriptional regulator n=1 Tax=Vallitalea okinawensis TaxID=2078660 RepID=UPI0014786B88|nr:AraC family transcriptional regulator [Vallitalea okinawensis]
MLKLESYIEIDTLMTFYYFDFAKNYVFKGEKHNFWEMVYVDKGVLEVMADTKHYVLNAGQMIFHKPNEFHSLWANGEVAPNVVVVSFVSHSDIMKTFEKKILQLNTEQKELYKKFIKIARGHLNKHHELIEDNPVIRQMLKMSLEAFLLEMMQNQDERKLPESLPTKERMEKDIVDHIIEYIRKNYNINLCLQDIAGYTNLSTSYIKALFKRRMNISLMRYYRQVRIEKAKELMRESSMSFTEIADKLGYASVHYFSKQFKDITGMTPTEYSKSMVNY